MINNIDKIKELINIDTEDDFYFLQIIQRRKENPDMKHNSKVIKEYYISSLEYLDERYEEIKTLCELFNARAQFNVNKKSYKKTFKEMFKLMGEVILNENYKTTTRIISKAVGSHSNESRNEKRWIIDIDEKLTEENLSDMIETINNIQPINDKFVSLIPSKSGYHLITNPFNIMEFIKKYPQYTSDDIKKDNPTNLYIP